ncbi:universal stress protein [Halobacterium rubrum]|uniref:universal stress protein n=1 Tax=Halobacterium TaxID=2239 RepID=UPI001F340014|nr:MULTISPECIES: universal stress protein [Halobacterium]MDH5021613.1 universal stress protein [Halobacterium rubrum]
MFDRILFPTDGSDGATAALDRVLDVAAAHDATVHLLSVANTTHSPVEQAEEIEGTLKDRAREAVESAAERAAERGVTTTTEVLEGSPHRRICDYAADVEVDVVAMPTRGRRGLARYLLGSTTERVVRRCEVPVLTFHPDDEDRDAAFDYPFETVLLATDGSDCARAALERAIDVVDRTGATLNVLSIVDTTSLGADVRTGVYREALEESAREVVDDASAFATEAGVTPAASVVEFAPSVSRGIRSYVEDHDVDLLVVGTHGRTGFDRFVLGSAAEFLVRTSPVPVLTVRSPAEDD